MAWSRHVASHELDVRGERGTEHQLSILVVGAGSGFGDIPAVEYARNPAAIRPRWRMTGSRLGGAPHGAAQAHLPGVTGGSQPPPAGSRRRDTPGGGGGHRSGDV